MESNVFQLSYGIKKRSSKQVLPKTYAKICDWILNTSLKSHGKNKEKQGFLLIDANTFLLPNIYIYRHIYVLYNDSIKCKRKSIARCEGVKYVALLPLLLTLNI